MFHETSFQPRSSARKKKMLGCLARETWQVAARFIRRRGSMAARGPGVTGKCYCHCLGDIIMLTKTVLNQSLETEGLEARLNAEKKEQKRR